MSVKVAVPISRELAIRLADADAILERVGIDVGAQLRRERLRRFEAEADRLVRGAAVTTPPRGLVAVGKGGQISSDIPSETVAAAKDTRRQVSAGGLRVGTHARGGSRGT